MRLDCWSPIHFFGSFFLSVFFCYLGVVYYKSWVLAFLCGCLWELLDECLGKSRRVVFFDPRGGSWDDILFDFWGCLVAYVMLYKITSISI